MIDGDASLSPQADGFDDIDRKKMHDKARRCFPHAYGLPGRGLPFDAIFSAMMMLLGWRYGSRRRRGADMLDDDAGSAKQTHAQCRVICAFILHFTADDEVVSAPLICFKMTAIYAAER